MYDDVIRMHLDMRMRSARITWFRFWTDILHWVQILQFSLESSFISLLCLQSEKKGFFYTQSQEPYHEGKRT